MSMLRFSVSCCLFAAAAIGQQIWNVNCHGSPGAQFTDLPAAVAAANPGDEIRIYYDLTLPPPVCYYHAPVITKPLRIVGFLAGPGGPGYHPVAVRGPLVIMGIPAGQRVEVHGLSIGAVSSLAGLPGAIIVLDCQGDVLLDSMELGSYGGPTTFGRIERCSNVVLRGCDITMSGDPLRIIDSQVLMTTTAIYYSPPTSLGFPYATTTESVRLTNSTLTTVGSLIRGVNATYYIQGPYLEQPGVVIESGRLRVGPASTIAGGVDPLFGGYQAQGVTVLNPAVGSVRIDPRGTVVNPGAPLIPETMHSTFHSWVVANETFGVTVAGPANGFALLAFGDWLPNTQSPLGSLAMDPNAILPVALVALPAPNGYFQWTLTCPLTAPVAHAYALQALTIAPNGALGVSVPSPLTVAWPRGIIP